jgi:1,4-dihydroxy-2-naphthoate octaprenyltransferase
MAIAVGLAWEYGYKIPWGWVACGAVALLFIEVAKHCFNDVCDYISGTDRFVEDKDVTPFSGGKKVITEGILSIKETVVMGVVAMSIAAILGILICLFKEPAVLVFGIVGIFISIEYSAKPFQFVYHGLGELCILIVYGPMIVMASYVLVTGHWATMPFLFSVVSGIHAMSLLWINEFPDHDADKKADKKHLVVRMGKKRSVYMFAVWNFLVFGGIIAISIYAQNWCYMLPFIGVVIAARATFILWNHYDVTREMVKSCELTIKGYMITGILMALSSVVSKLMFS